MKKTQTERTKDIVEVALFGAIVIILAFTPFLGYIPLGFTRATTVHIPVILASILLGPKKGAIIGLTFGLTSLFKNTFEPTVTSFVFSPFYSVGNVNGNIFSLIICLVPRTLVGVVPYYVFNLFKKFNKSNVLALTLSGVLGSLTNTLLVMNMIVIFFSNDYAAANNISVDALYGFILSIIAINGVPEAIVASIVVACVGKVLIKVRYRESFA